MNTLRILAFAILTSFATPNYSAEPAPMTLEQLQARIPFSSWVGHVSPKALEESRLIYKETLSKLILTGAGRSTDSYIPALNKYIEEFNRIDEKYEFIETVEREDICESLEEILDVLQLPGIEECDDLPAVRNW
jgi:hypothetical protein